ncbi:metal-dependent hydrolase [Novosphingobium sp. TH158]|uniref:metal-dependent hydrolase n=1 Tax=Novosphingobium sp. TH158 TaxID=2067455 RepID=UPI000C7A4216|nr:metal-dependent hydrolase [Novosphingobium sp. TH158]PLK26251.1 metal-dependent hydrolase [Novosphingobium sp. TH158]
MDNLTHSLIGAALGQAGLKRRTGLAMPALIIGANIPDIDAACFFWLDGTEHLGFRRGITHGPPAMLLLPLLLAGLLWGFDRWQAGRGKRPEGRLPVRFGWLYALALVGCLSHPLFDWFNVYGIRLLEPFSSRWFHGDILFIIDIWLWALLGLAVWLSRRRERAGGNWTGPARAALVVMAGYVGLNAAITSAAERRFQAIAGEGAQVIANPVPVAFWTRQGLAGEAFQWSQVTTANGAAGLAPLTRDFCAWPDARQLASSGSQSAAFLFWTRAPFAERGEDGSVVLRDARFYDRRARGQFSVSLPQVKCLPLATR